jgi:hypothetical protein
MTKFPKLKYKVKQHADGKWYVQANTKQYFTKPYESERAAVEASLLREGHELSDKLYEIQRRMESLPGFIDSRDPYGWRA